ncbi:hypothetical protein GCM10007358_04950 [Phocicoccus schoeneichii]|nr:hypothetical protein GCM10007358_04950 [Jeotgalicoccus schoeneichii]
MILPLLGALAITLDVHPMILMAPAAIAANCAFMLPVGTPPNAIVFGTGKVSIKDMVSAGFWLNIIAWIGNDHVRLYKFDIAIKKNSFDIK